MVEINGKLNLKPSSEPAISEEGDIYYDSAAKALKVYDGSSYIQQNRVVIYEGNLSDSNIAIPSGINALDVIILAFSAGGGNLIINNVTTSTYHCSYAWTRDSDNTDANVSTTSSTIGINAGGTSSNPSVTKIRFELLDSKIIYSGVGHSTTNNFGITMNGYLAESSFSSIKNSYSTSDIKIKIIGYY